MSPSLKKNWVHLAQLSILILWPDNRKNRYIHTNEKILPIYICLDTCMKYIYMYVSTIHYLYWGRLKPVDTSHLITKFPWHHWLFNDNLLESLAHASAMLHLWNIYIHLTSTINLSRMLVYKLKYTIHGAYGHIIFLHVNISTKSH